MVLLGRSHPRRPEAGGTLTTISHRVEISIAKGEADEKPDWKKGLSFFLFFCFFYHVLVVKVQETV